MLDIRKHQTSTCRLPLEAICCAPPDDIALLLDTMSMDFEFRFATGWRKLECHCKLAELSCTGFQELMSSAIALEVKIDLENTASAVLIFGLSRSLYTCANLEIGGKKH